MQMEPTEAYEVLCYVPTEPALQPARGSAGLALVALPKEDPTAQPPASQAPVGRGREGGLCTSCLPLVRAAPQVCPEQKAVRPGLCTQQLKPLTHPCGQHLLSLSERATEMG